MSTFGGPDWGDTSFTDGGVAGSTPGTPGGGGTGGGGTTAPTIVSFTGSTSTSTAGTPVTLSFDVTDATTISISPDVGPVLASPVTVSPTTTTVYTITATGPGGSATATVTVTILGASAENIRYHQIRRNDRQGNGIALQMSGPGNTAVDGYPALYDSGGNVIARQPRGNTTVAQLADQTGGYTLDHLLSFDTFGNAKDSGVAIADIVTPSVLSNSWYGQIPRGTVNGANNVFTIDYRLANPYTVLHLNGIVQLPSIQGDPATLTGTMAVPGGEYSITNWTLTVDNAPKAGERFYIEYFRGDPGVVLANVASATVSVWTSFTSDDVAHAFANSTFTSSAGSNLINTTNVLHARRHDTLVLSTFPLTVEGFLGSSVQFDLDGTLSAEAGNYINVYDCYIDLILDDASVQTIRPLSWGFTSGSDAGGLGSIETWKPTHGYSTAITIMDSNTNLQTSTVAGTSGASQPVWATSGNTSDGGVTWTYAGTAASQTSTTGQITSPTLAYDADISPPVTFAIFKRIHYSGFSTGGTFTVIF